ncbi:MAG: HlyD family efflux transporter periplasmic adaptor subunit [Planctomycetota bacterium]|nr:HlyD family efflux transporter periplasmic adaptor subunit [Planctomycetota bacterium]
MKITAITLVVTLVSGFGVWVTGLFGSGEDEARGMEGTYAVRRGSLPITLTERGTLKTKNSTVIRAETHAKIEWLIDEGKMVKKGDILVELEKTDVQQQVDSLKNQVTQLESELKSAETDEVIQRTKNLTDVEKAELNLEVATVTLEKLLKGDIPQEERKHKLAIEKAESDVRRYSERVQAYRELIKEEFVTADQLEQEELRLKTAQNELESARLDKELYLKYKKPLDIKQKKAGVIEAERGVGRTKKQAEAHLDAKQARVRQKRVTLEAVRKRLKRQEEILGKMTLKAPIDGTVMYGDPDHPWQRRNIKVGKQVWNSAGLVTLPDPKEMVVTIHIHEADIAKVKKGMSAFITSEMQKDKTHEGEVTKVDTVANVGRPWERVKKFKVEVSLTGKDLDLKTGTTAEVEIKIDELVDVLFVPVQAVHTKEGKFFCYVRDGSQDKRVDVKLGKANDSFVVVTEGLDEGDRVLLHSPASKEQERTGGALGGAGASGR